MDKIEKDLIFNRSLQYFSFNYNKGDNVIQIQDKDMGVIVGKGLTQPINNISYSLGLQSLEISAWHLLKFEVREGRVRVSLYYNDYQVVWRGESERIRSSHILLEPPIAEKPGEYINTQLSKKRAVEFTTETFNQLLLNAELTFNEIEKFLHNIDTEDDW